MNLNVCYGSELQVSFRNQTSLVILLFFCQEPLRASLSSQLRISLQGVGLPSDVLGSVVSLIVEDNVDLGCVVIANAATDKVLSHDAVSYQIASFPVGNI